MSFQVVTIACWHCITTFVELGGGYPTDRGGGMLTLVDLVRMVDAMQQVG